MFNKWLIAVGLMTLLSGSVVACGVMQKDTEAAWSEEEFIRIVHQYYMDDSGKIRSYGTEENEEYLLESMGLYMKWLSGHNREEEVQELRKTVQSEFAYEHASDVFLSWRVEGDQQASVNAWIDDARILSVLGPADPLFDKIADTLKKYQVQDGLIVDFYDWEQEAASERVVLSYGTSQEEVLRLTSMDRLYLEASTRSDPFYPEFYDVKEKKFIESDEVHMVDQLLIAIQLEKEKGDNHEFWQWLVSEWEKHQAISGRYDRNSHKGNGIESGAVYGIAAEWALLKGEEELAEKWKHKGFQLVNPKDHQFDQIHFFDLIWNAP